MVLVHNPATDIQFANSNVGVVYVTKAVDISDQLRRNISFLPAGYESVESFVHVDRVYEPDDLKNEKYNRLFPLYNRLYESNADLMHGLAALN